MPGRIILSEYVYVRRRNTAVTPPYPSDTGEAARWLKSFAFHFAGLRVKLRGILTISELAPFRRIVKLHALTPPETCLLRGIVDSVVGDRAPSFPTREDKTLRTPKFNTGKVVERRMLDTRRKRDILPLHAQHAPVIVLALSLHYRISYVKYREIAK